MEDAKHPHYVKRALARLRGGKLLVSQCSSSDEAVVKGDGHVYFTHPDGRAFPTASAVYAIRNELVRPAGDDFFGGSQTYQLSDEGLNAPAS